MSKKYLSLEEAAEVLKMQTAELNRLRDKGDIRAFADRGSWKFREEDVLALMRSRQADSNPELPLMSGGASEDVLSEDDDDVLGSQPTIIRKNKPASDSDVRLIFDDHDTDDVGKGSVSDVMLPLSDSDSDVRLAGELDPRSKDASDSDVKLIKSTSDSDVRLFGSTSDSDVKLIGGSSILTSRDQGSDSDVKIAGDLPLSDGPGPDDRTDMFTLAMPSDDEGISLAPLDDKPAKPTAAAKPAAAGNESVLDDDIIAPLAADSGISLERVADSGISLDADSSLKLGTGESGISLDLGPDSGISLAQSGPLAGGRAEAKKGDKKGDKKENISGTAPMPSVPLLDEDDLVDTNLEIPLMSDDGSSGEHDSTNVIMLDDEEEVDDYAQTMVKKGPRQHSPTIADDASSEEFEISEDVVDLGDDDSVEVSDEIIGEDDEIEDVFGADEEDFAEDGESGESLGEMSVSPARAMLAPVEQEWGVWPFVGVLVTSITMVMTGAVMTDLIRNMWFSDVNRTNPLGTILIDSLSGMF